MNQNGVREASGSTLGVIFAQSWLQAPKKLNNSCLERSTLGAISGSKIGYFRDQFSKNFGTSFFNDI